MKKRNPLHLVLLSLIIIALALTACNTASEPTQVVSSTVVPPNAVIAEGQLVPNEYLYISAPVYSKVAEILVENGDQVAGGDILIRLADRDQAEASLLAAETERLAAQQAYDDFIRLAALASAQAHLALIDAQITRADAQKFWDDLDVDEIQDRIEEAEAEVNDALEELEEAQEDFDKYADLSENNASRTSAKDDLDEAEAAFNEALRIFEETQHERDLPRARLDQALASETEALRNYANSQGGPDPEQLARLSGRLESAQAQLAAAETNLANYDITAPFDGTVVDLNVSENERVGPENWAVLVADFSQWYVETTDLTELKVVKIAEGQSASLVPDALPELEIQGTVEEIFQGFYVQGGDISYKVRLSLSEVDPQLRWGMTVEITFAPLE